MSQIAPHDAKETEHVVARAEALAVIKTWKMKGFVSSICSLNKRAKASGFHSLESWRLGI